MKRVLTGCVAELVACADLLNRGYSVYRAVMHNAPFDLVAVWNGNLVRIEVKTGEDVRRVKVNSFDFDKLALVSRKSAISYFDVEEVIRLKSGRMSTEGPDHA